MSERCLYFGCWGVPGHYLHLPGGEWSRNHSIEWFNNGQRHIDGTLAPRKHNRTGETVWEGMGERPEDIKYKSSEYPQGRFLRHELDNGFTAIQWWDRAQGDKRGACNSTILLEGKHTSEEMLAALEKHFPQVLARLKVAGIELVEVHVQ